MPEITVLMPVRNGERYIKESIDSVLNRKPPIKYPLSLYL